MYHRCSGLAPRTCSNCSKCSSFRGYTKSHQFPVARCSPFPAFPLYLSQSSSYPFVQSLIHAQCSRQSKVGYPTFLPERVRLIRWRILSIKRSFVRFAKQISTSPFRFRKLNPGNFARVARSTLLFFGLIFNFNFFSRYGTVFAICAKQPLVK